MNVIIGKTANRVFISRLVGISSDPVTLLWMRSVAFKTSKKLQEGKNFTTLKLTGIFSV